MENSEIEENSFREKYLNKKVVLIVIGVVILLGGLTAGGLLKASAKPSFCSSCHIIKPYYESWSEGDLLDNKHAQHDVACLECHHRTIPEKAKEGLNYITGNYSLPLEAPPGDREFCLACHSEDGKGTSWEEIKASTDFEESNPHDSHHGEQDCNLCHNMHGKSKPMCVECHIFDWYDELDASWTVDSATEQQ